MKKYFSKIKLLFMWSIFGRSLVLGVLLGGLFGGISGGIIGATGGDWDKFASGPIFNLATTLIAWGVGYIVLWHMLLKRKDVVITELEKDAQAAIKKAEDKLKKLKEAE